VNLEADILKRNKRDEGVKKVEKKKIIIFL
jgi:hypothetical protein